MKYLLLCIALSALMLGVYADSFYPTTVSDLTAHVTLGGSGSISGLKNGEEVKFQTLTFSEAPQQTVSAVDEKLSINGTTILPSYVFDEYGNKYASFSVTQNGDFTYTVSATVHRTAHFSSISDFNIETNIEQQEYTHQSEKIESDSLEIRTLAKNKLYKNNYLDTVNDAIVWVNDYVEYAKGEDFSKYYLLQVSAVQTLLDRKGVCDEFSNLAAAMLRAKKIPTRINIGITFDGQEWGNHAWISTYADGAGWISSDPTFRESGFVDATHLKLANFLDETESVAKAIYPTTATVAFKTQSLPQVNVLDVKYFTDILIDVPDNNLIDQQWNHIPVNITNNTDTQVTVPLIVGNSTNAVTPVIGCINNTNRCVYLKDNKKSVTIPPKDTVTTYVDIYPDMDLQKNEYVQVSPVFYSVTTPTKATISILPSKKTEAGGVSVKDITPIATDAQLTLITKVGNYEGTAIPIDINVTDNNSGQVYSWTDSIAAFSIKNNEHGIPLNEYGYTVHITTPTERATQVIYLDKQKITVTPTQQIQPVITQNIDLNQNATIQEKLKENPEVIVFALLAGVAVLLLGLFIVRKRYV